MSEQRRKTIPPATREKILMEAGYKCANPNCRHIITLEMHHILWVKDGGGDDPENLLALCPNCHTLHTQGHIPGKAIEVWKSMLVSLNNPNRANVDLLLLLYKDETQLAAARAEGKRVDPAFQFSGDGLGTLASLISAELLEIYNRHRSSSMHGNGIQSFEVRLTESGQRLVKAWLAGSPKAIKEALRHQSNQVT